jgi:hypothetical protein
MIIETGGSKKYSVDIGDLLDFDCDRWWDLIF